MLLIESIAYKIVIVGIALFQLFSFFFKERTDNSVRDFLILDLIIEGYNMWIGVGKNSPVWFYIEANDT